MSESMNAMVLKENRPVEQAPLALQEVEKPTIHKENELILQIKASGVCHSNLHSIEGDWKKFGIPPKLPVVPGHEPAGEVVETGSGVKKIKTGDRVGVSFMHSSCMDCEFCRQGKEQLCDNMVATGEATDGGFAEYMKVSEDFATKIPDSFDYIKAAPLFCAGLTAYKAVVACEPQKNETVGLYGIGGVGHMAVEFANHYGMRAVAISRNKRHLDVAEKLGAANTIPYDLSRDGSNKEESSIENEFVEKIKKEEGSKLLDKAIVFAPSKKVTDIAVKSVKKGGVVVTATFENQPEIHAFEEKTVRGTLIGSRKDMQDCLAIADEASMDVEAKSFSLGKANEVLKMLKDSQIDARAVLVPS